MITFQAVGFCIFEIQFFELGAVLGAVISKDGASAVYLLCLMFIAN